jgi:pimeloyl-ACP methyl ester carboxylesterase
VTGLTVPTSGASSPQAAATTGGQGLVSQAKQVGQRTCPFALPAGVKVTATCSTVTVPLNRAHPDGRTVRLAVARLSSSVRDNADETPVAFLNGGPGGATLTSVPSVLAASPILAERDMVLWDQRGTGASRPRLGCPGFQEASEAIQRTAKSGLADARALMKASRGCVARLSSRGIDLTAFNTIESAADVDDVRRALGISTWDLLGVSYGTALAQETMRRYPQGIRRVILDSVLPPNRTRPTDVFTIDGEFGRLMTACQLDRACHTMLPNPQQALDRVVARYNAKPRPVVIDADPETGSPRHRVLMTGNDVAGLFAQATGTFGVGDPTEILASLPQRLARLEAGDPRGLDELVRLYRAPVAPTSLNDRYDQAMAWSVMCHDRRRLVDRQQTLDIIRKSPRTAWTSYSQSSSLFCADWPSGAAPMSFTTPLRSTIPTLVLAGEFDYQTPLDWSREVAEGLPRSRFVGFGTSGHALVATGCGQTVIASYLASPSAEPDTTCVPPLRRTRFVTR